MHGAAAGADGSNVKRTMSIEKSSYIKRYETDFELTQEGVRGKN